VRRIHCKNPLQTQRGAEVAEILVSFTQPTRDKNGDLYYGAAVGRRLAPDGMWEGWIEFALAGTDEVVVTGRETEQANRDDLKYWASGLSAGYLEGALQRALRTPIATSVQTAPAGATDPRSATEADRHA
jgi:hypothetical protein